MKTAILKNIYRNGNKVPMMFRNGDLIYHMITKLVFGVDTDSLIFPLSGGTQTITITANDDWTMTVPNWLTASALSGTTGATITLTASSSQEEKSGSIVISCGDRTHTITVKQGVSLPDKTFVFNYNARDYDATTYTIPKNSGQTLNEDLVYTGTGKTGITKSNDHITLPASATSQINFSTSGANPLNLTASNNNLTIVFKAKYVYNGSYDLRGDFMNNQASRANWMVRIGSRESYSTSLTKITFTYNDSTVTWDTGLVYTCGDTITGAIVVDNGSYVIKNLGTAESTTAISIPNNGGYGAGVETLKSIFTGDFYWCYCSREVLTDSEIQQVVDYNGGITEQASCEDQGLCDDGEGNCVECGVDCDNWETLGYQSYEDCTCENYQENCSPVGDPCEDWEGNGYESYEDCTCQNHGQNCGEGEDPCEDWEGNGYSSWEECECSNYGANCEEPEEEPEEEEPEE